MDVPKLSSWPQLLEVLSPSECAESTFGLAEFQVEGLEFWGLGFKGWASGFRVWGLGVGRQGLGFRV